MFKGKVVEGTRIVPVTKKFDNTVELCWVKADNPIILHNIDHPAVFSCKYNKTREYVTIFKRFYKNNVLDNGGKPDTISVFKIDDTILFKCLYFQSRHSFDYPEIERCSDIETITWRMNGCIHKFDGPAVIINEKYEKQLNQHFFLNQEIPKNIIRFENSLPSKELNKASILEGSLFDGHYGKVLETVYSTQKIPTEKEVFDIIGNLNE